MIVLVGEVKEVTVVVDSIDDVVLVDFGGW